MSLIPSNLRLSSEILILLHFIKQSSQIKVSKLGLQKLLYLGKSFSTVKNVVLSTINFVSEKRGPYSKSVQNSLDQLVALGYVEITEYNQLFGKNTLVYYTISEAGETIFSSFNKLPRFKEQVWWLSVIVRLSKIYSEELSISEQSKFQGIDTIVRLVYQDPTFLSIKDNDIYRQIIPINEIDTPTSSLVSFTYDIIRRDDRFLKNKSSYFKAEYVIMILFELLMANYIDSAYEQ